MKRVKTKEIIPAWLIALAATFTLGGYEFVRSPSNSLFMKFYGKEGLPLIQSVMPLGVVFIIYIYSRILSWVGPRKTLMITTLGSAGLIVASYYAIDLGFKPASGFLYILREGYSVLIIEQYWSFLNSFLEEKTAKKVNGPICGVASLGAIVCGLVVSRYAVRLGTETMLLFAASACVPAALISDWAYRMAGPRVRIIPEPSQGKKDHLGLHLFRKEPALIRLLLIIIATQVVSAVSGLAFQGELFDSLKDMDKQTAWQGGFYAAVNAFSALFQFVLSPLCLSFLPLGLVHLLIPSLQLGFGVYALLNPSLYPCAIAFLLFKVFDYSIFRSAKELLYIPFSFDVRFRAKEIIDVFGYRFGKGGASLAITGLQSVGMKFSTSLYHVISLVALGTWAVLIFPWAKKHWSKDDNGATTFKK